ncbi:MAG: IS66 family transposase [Verrucomicrobiota bacterium]
MKNERPSKPQLVRELNEDPEKGADLILSLMDRCDKLEERVKSLESNSRNSSKPPSSDIGKPNPQSQRKSSDKKPGGQPGHKGSTLELVDAPDTIITNEFPEGSRCENCGGHLPSGQHECEFERRQVIDLPAIRFETTEYRSPKIICPLCDATNTAPFPPNVKARVQYGESTQACALYLGAYQMIPYQRLQELFEVIFNRSLSQGTLANFIKRGGAKAGVAALDIRDQLKASPVIHGDETGCRVHGLRHWLHVASTDELTYFMIHEKRGVEALESMEILNDYQGRVVHDYFQSYYRYCDCEHFQCNAHILRELTYIHEDLDQEWAKSMKELLIEAKALRDREDRRKPEDRKIIGERTRQRIRQRIRRRYNEIVLAGYEINPEPEPIPGKRGKPKRGKALNLLHRMEQKYEEIVGFFEYEGIPFDNNLAERDLRMMKVREKISGTFRSNEHTSAFANIRSIVSTLKKQRRSVLPGISEMIRMPEKMFSP